MTFYRYTTEYEELQIRKVDCPSFALANAVQM
jgi:hypothetical protein